MKLDTRKKTRKKSMAEQNCKRIFGDSVVWDESGDDNNKPDDTK